MKTDDLILALSADAAPRGPSLRRRVALGLAIGALVSLAAFMSVIGPRPDFMGAAHTMRFDLKFLDTLAVLAPAFFLCLRLSRPEAAPAAILAWLLAPVVILGAAVAMELATVPSAQWGAKLVGSNSMHCLMVIPILSIPPLAALIFALREGAPRHPALTGALAGAAAAGVGATIYASNCPDDSPLFVVTWYPIATAVVVLVGALAGRRWLAW
jgi:hypothetical protein